MDTTISLDEIRMYLSLGEGRILLQKIREMKEA